MKNKKSYLKVAIDGPAGAGKSTVSRAVSSRLNLKYLDTGAMYRAITLKVIREGINISDLDALGEMLDRTSLQLGDDQKVYLDGEDVTAAIRSPEVNELVSPVSAVSLVRRRMVKLQQGLADQSAGIIMEGRDIGSKVMPEADYKFYLDASIEERTRRRLKEQLEKGLLRSEGEVAAEIGGRDEIDSNRGDSPLSVVADAVVIDTTVMTFDEVVEKITRIVSEGLS